MPISDVVVELEKIITQLSTARDVLIGNSSNGSGTVKHKKHHTMSAAARRRISLAQKARWRTQKRKAA
jgi:hypothetical protein